MIDTEKTCKNCENREFCKHMAVVDKYLGKIQDQEFMSISISCDYFREHESSAGIQTPICDTY